MFCGFGGVGWGETKKKLKRVKGCGLWEKRDTSLIKDTSAKWGQACASEIRGKVIYLNSKWLETQIGFIRLLQIHKKYWHTDACIIILNRP